MRATLRRARRAFAVGPGAAAHAEALTALLIARLPPLLAAGGAVSGYVAHRGEPDILPVLLHLHALGHATTLPHIDDDRRMHFAPWHPQAALAPGALGIPQPEATEERIVPSIVLTPLVGFDRGGQRLGQGGGYYDRWFAAHPAALRIGIAWSVQETAALPRDAWDMPLHAIATEREWISP
ncbi:MAG TPA: 5-formyltetrahydrofolate cyclo-ligase [Sphingomonas sp.]